MIDKKVSSRYASSLLQFAQEKKLFEQISQDFLFVSKVLNENPKLVNALSSPVIKPSIKKAIIKEVFEKNISAEALSFLLFLIDKNRENLLQAIIRQFFNLRNDLLGLADVDVQVAFDISEEQQNLIKTTLEKLVGKKISISVDINKNLIGGFVARLNDTVFDASIKHQLELLKKQLLMGSVSKN